MGYTNYWHQTKAFTDKEWKSVKDEYNYIKDVCNGIIVDETKDENEIIFNGNPIGDLCHETFVLTKNPRTIKHYEDDDLSFHFCKTAEKPYDIAVWHMLFFAKNKTKALSKIKRDR